MNITGRLKNAAGGNDDVFAGYAVEVRYYAAADAPDKVRTVEDRAVCAGTDPSFTFALAAAPSLEQDLQVVVRNRRNEQVYRETRALVEALRQPLVLPIQLIDASAPVTPVAVKGRLQWKNAPAKTDGYAGSRSA